MESKEVMLGGIGIGLIFFIFLLVFQISIFYVIYCQLFLLQGLIVVSLFVGGEDMDERDDLDDLDEEEQIRYVGVLLIYVELF